MRFETPAGQQLQADFTTIRRGRDPLKAFVATLGFSRATFVRFSAREDSDAWLTGLREAFVYFGGVPREVLFDNAAAIISERDAYGEGQHRWHPALFDLAKTYGFRPKVCRPYRTQTKGKVERFNGYLKSSFITPLAATLHSAGFWKILSWMNRELSVDVPWEKRRLRPLGVHIKLKFFSINRVVIDAQIVSDAPAIPKHQVE